MEPWLTVEDVNLLRKMRDAMQAGKGAPQIPVKVAVKLRLLGYLAAHADGRYSLTLKARDQLIDRERETAPRR
jgi:hypothetical protein